MLISNGSALNILLANNNRVLNDALKEADNKTLNNILKQDSSNSSSSTNTAASSILKEVLNSIKDGTKSNSSLENILKNSTAFKDLGTLSSNLSSLLESIKDDEEPVEEITDLMYHINTEDKPFTARKENGVFIVEGKLIEQLLASVNLDDNDSIKYFQKVLRKRGIVDELRQLGVKDGDTIRMLDLEFEYFE